MSSSENTVMRPALMDDMPHLLSINNDSIMNSTSNYCYEPQTLEDQQKWFEDRIAKNFPVIVVEYGGAIIGFGTYGSFRERIGFRFTVEHSVYLRPGNTGKGIGSLLMTELIQLAKAQGMHNMIACIDGANTGSIRFHERLGFQNVGTIKEVGYKFDRWLDMTLMQLTL